MMARGAGRVGVVSMRSCMRQINSMTAQHSHGNSALKSLGPTNLCAGRLVIARMRSCMQQIHSRTGQLSVSILVLAGLGWAGAGAEGDRPPATCAAH